MAATASSTTIQTGRGLLRDFARLLLLAVVLPVLVLAGLVLWQGAAATRANFSARLAGSAELTANDVDRFLQAHLAALEVLAEHRAVAADLGNQAGWANDLQRVGRHYAGFNSLAVISEAGRLIVVQPFVPGAQGSSVADRGYFLEPRRTRRAQISSAYRGRIGKDLPSVALSAPMYVGDRFAGVVSGAIRIDTFTAMHSRELQSRGYEMLLLDRNHTVVHASNGLPYRSLDVLRDAGRDRPLRALESSGSRTRMQRVPGVLRDGGDAYGLMVPLDVGWRLLLLMPERVVSAELRRNTMVMLGLLALTLLGVLTIYVVHMRRLGRCARDLLVRMQCGDRDSAPVPPESLPRELTPLVESINQLAARDRAAYSEVSASLQEQNRLREELQAMARQLLTAQEDERRAISRELHDDIGQQITAIKLGATVLLGDDDPGQRAEILEEIITTTDQTVAKLRNLSLLLRPPQLDSLGIEAALRSQAERMFRAGRPRLELALATLPRRPDAEVELACFRIAQEALTNIQRHADATRVTLTLASEPQGQFLLLIIGDDGQGFDSRRLHGLGLVTMRERAQQLGGTLEIETGTVHGTWVRATLPMHRPV